MFTVKEYNSPHRLFSIVIFLKKHSTKPNIHSWFKTKQKSKQTNKKKQVEVRWGFPEGHGYEGQMRLPGRGVKEATCHRRLQETPTHCDLPSLYYWFLQNCPIFLHFPPQVTFECFCQIVKVKSSWCLNRDSVDLQIY